MKCCTCADFRHAAAGLHCFAEAAACTAAATCSTRCRFTAQRLDCSLSMQHSSAGDLSHHSSSHPTFANLHPHSRRKAHQQRLPPVLLLSLSRLSRQLQLQQQRMKLPAWMASLILRSRAVWVRRLSHSHFSTHGCFAQMSDGA